MSTSDSIVNLIQPHLRAMPGYVPVEPPEFLAERLGISVDEVIKLDANENPYGPAPAVVKALAGFARYDTYPDPEQRRLRTALASYTGFPPEWLLAGAGTDELIDLLTRMFVPPGGAVVNFPPTFGMYAFSADIQAARLVEVRREEDFSLDIPASVAALEEGNLAFAVSPNNPTGTLLREDELSALLTTGKPVVLDEAYAEFAGTSYIEWVRDHPNLIVLRTLSKWAGLAGLRVGFMVARPEVIEVAAKVRQPYSVSVVAEIAAITSIEHKDEQQPRIDAIVAERGRLASRLTALGALDVIPSSANFLLCRLRTGDARDVQSKLESRGIMVRFYDNALLRNFLRITIGTPAQDDRLLAALAEILSAPAGTASR